MNTRCLRLASALLVAGAGCVGSVESVPSQPGTGSSGGSGADPGSPANPGPGAAPTIPTGPGQPAGECRESAPQVTAARRLTREEYSNTVRDLLGDDRGLGDRLPSDDGNDGLLVEPGTLKPDDDAGTKAKLIKVNRWYAEQVGTLLEKMDSVQEGNGKTMLDNSFVIWTDGLGKGNNHTRKNIPWVLAGSANGYMPTGRFMDMGNQPHNHLLVDILHAMGIPDDNFFGHPSLKDWSGPLPGLATKA